MRDREIVSAAAVQFRYRQATEDRTGLAGVKRTVYRVSCSLRGTAMVWPYGPVSRNNQEKENMWCSISRCAALWVVSQARAGAVAPSTGVSRCLADSYSPFTRQARLPNVFYRFFQQAVAVGGNFPRYLAAADPAFQFQLQPIAVFRIRVPSDGQALRFYREAYALIGEKSGRVLCPGFRPANLPLDVTGGDGATPRIHSHPLVLAGLCVRSL